MKTRAPELRALITIFRSTGPVISTRRSAICSGGGATTQSPSRTLERLLQEGRELALAQPLRALGATHEKRVALGPEAPLELREERKRLGREDVVRPHATVSSNCCSSVDPLRASVEASPPETTCITSSK